MQKKNWILIKIVSILCFPLVLWILPADFFDQGGIVICVSKRFFGLECPGCGLTRAVMHFHHLELSQALSFNKLVVLFYPLLVFVWLKWVIDFWSAYQKIKQ